MNESINQIQQQKLKNLQQEKAKLESQLTQLLSLNRSQQAGQRLIEQFALNLIELESIHDLPALLDDTFRGGLGASWTVHLAVETLPQHLRGQIHFLCAQKTRRYLHEYFSGGRTEFNNCDTHTQQWLFGRQDLPFVKIIPLENLEDHGFLALGFSEAEPLSAKEPFFRFVAKAFNSRILKLLRKHLG